MNNEPVAWINREEGSGSILDWEKDPYSEVNIPLYTHPLKDKPHPKCDEACMYLCQMRELTDKEILEICDLGEWHRDEFAINFARAILRKAQGD